MDPAPQPSLRTEQQLQMLIDSVRDYAIFLLDPEGRVITWNQGAQRIKGYTFDEIRGRHFSVFYPREDIESGKPEYELKVAAQEGRFEDEGWRIRKDGSRFWANVVITALKDESGVLLGFGKVTRDISERKWAMEANFEKLFRSSPNPILLSGLDDARFIEVNDAFCELLGYPREELIGQSSITLGVWLYAEERTRIVTELKAGRPVRGEACEMRTKSGDRRNVEVSADMIEFRGNPCLFATLLDTTESRPIKDTTLACRGRKERGPCSWVCRRWKDLWLNSGRPSRSPRASGTWFSSPQKALGFLQGTLQVRGGFDYAEPGAHGHKGIRDDCGNAGENNVGAQKANGFNGAD